MWSRISLFFLMTFALACVGQETATPAAPAVNNDFVQKQFGSEFTLVTSMAPLSGDFDGDGIPDIAFITRAKNPLIDEAEHKYKVLDPYDDFFGIGGSSLEATLVVGEVRRLLDLDVPVVLMFQFPTVRQSAAALAATFGEDAVRRADLILRIREMPAEERQRLLRTSRGETP